MADLSNVYDYFCPSPISLRDLACKEVALILWRAAIQLNINESGTLRERYEQEITSIRSGIREAPSTVASMIDDYVRDLQISIPRWVNFHYSACVLGKDVFKHFYDFVFDFDGSIHHAKTAKRFLACKRIGDEEKFRMACFYCFEDDILRIWPRVVPHEKADSIGLDYSPWYFYWKCRLTNPPQDDFDYDTNLEDLCDHYNFGEWSSAKYYWNILPADTRMKHLRYLLGRNRLLELEDNFFRYGLANLNEAELEVVRENYAGLVTYSKYPYTTRIWQNIKNKITAAGFRRLVEYILRDETENSKPDYHAQIYLEIWANAPTCLKELVIQGALLVIDDFNFDRTNMEYIPRAKERRCISFLYSVLCDLPLEDRKKFWKTYWATIYVDIRPVDFRFLISICFEDDEDEIARFRKQAMSGYHEKIHPELKKLLENGFLEELEDFLRFWCPNDRNRKEVRLMLLHDSFTISTALISQASSLNEFIENAFENQDLIGNFKANLMLLPDLNTAANLMHCIYAYEFPRVMEFVDTFSLSDELIRLLKRSVIEPLLEELLNEPRGCRIKDPAYVGKSIRKFLHQDFDAFDVFICWLFESDARIDHFKGTLDMDTAVQRLIEGQQRYLDQNPKAYLDDWFRNCFRTLNPNDNDSFLKKFLIWYFVDAAAVEDFEKNYSHESIFNRLLRI